MILYNEYNFVFKQKTTQYYEFLVVTLEFYIKIMKTTIALLVEGPFANRLFLPGRYSYIHQQTPRMPKRLIC